MQMYCLWFMYVDALYFKTQYFIHPSWSHRWKWIMSSSAVVQIYAIVRFMFFLIYIYTILFCKALQIIQEHDKSLHVQFNFYWLCVCWVITILNTMAKQPMHHAHLYRQRSKLRFKSNWDGHYGAICLIHFEKRPTL